MRFSAVLAGLMLVGAPALADPIEGNWQTEVDDGFYAIIEMSPCGEAYCGIIARTFDAEGEFQGADIGKQLVIDMVPKGEGEYRGSVWRPSNDKIYVGKMRLNGDSVRLRGCVAGGLICSGQTWQRVD